MCKYLCEKKKICRQYLPIIAHTASTPSHALSLSLTNSPGGYTTEVTKISYEEALRRQSELRGQKLRSLPKSWEEQGPPPEAPGIGR